MNRLRGLFSLPLVGVAGGAGFLLWLSRTFPVLAWIVSAQNAVAGMAFWGALLYPMLFALCNVLLLPGGVLAIGSGLFFGLWWGFFLNLAGSSLGASIAFLVSRCLARGWIERRFFHRPKWAALDAAIAREGWKIIFLSQVHPLFPTSLLNYLYGATRIRFSTCMLWLMLGQAPGLFLYAYLGTLVQLGVRVWRGENPPASEYGLWIGGLALSLGVTTVLARLALRLLAEVNGGEPKSAPSPAVEIPFSEPF
jgi:uncharacterized membrane protein YdjX (TVP38/TMEM64 family)